MTDLTSLNVGGVPVLGAMPLGLPFTGNYYFVDAVAGADGNTGAADSPMASLTAAYARCVAGNNDVVVIMGDGGTTATQRLSSTLTWAKAATHLIGMTAPTMVSQRARISTAAGATANVNPLVEVTAQGCLFANFSLFQGVGQSATDEQLWKESGQRNCYVNVDFGGMGSANGAGRAGSYGLLLYGAGECTFRGCRFGTDTQDRTAANANVRIRKNASNTECKRIIFEDCEFSMRCVTNTTPLFVDADEASSIDRYIRFKDCTFINTGTATPAVVAAQNATNAYLLFDRCCKMLATSWGVAGRTNIYVNGPATSTTVTLAGSALPNT